MGYSHINKKGKRYYLNVRYVQLKNSTKKTPIYYFSRDQRDTNCPLPEGYEVSEYRFLTLKRVQ